jgi:hypothetical protein
VGRYDQRIAKLERTSAGAAGKMYVIKAPDGMSTDDALATMGIVPGIRDMVVRVRTFSPSPTNRPAPI